MAAENHPRVPQVQELRPEQHQPAARRHAHQLLVPRHRHTGGLHGAAGGGHRSQRAPAGGVPGALVDRGGEGDAARRSARRLALRLQPEEETRVPGEARAPGGGGGAVAREGRGGARSHGVRHCRDAHQDLQHQQHRPLLLTVMLSRSSVFFCPSVSGVGRRRPTLRAVHCWLAVLPRDEPLTTELKLQDAASTSGGEKRECAILLIVGGRPYRIITRVCDLGRSIQAL
mmetsp:Transcript_33254/g.72556  ORF Transcript_33254/g.72556 Transcript_33254/m.72556 type:complete len:229 (-) Transcript_33254:140-826(-)